MAKKYDAAVIGGDSRQAYLADILGKEGFKIIAFGLSEKIIESGTQHFDTAASAEQAVKSAMTVVAPIPMSKDNKHITVLDKKDNPLTVEELLSYMDRDQFLIAGSMTMYAEEFCVKNGIMHLDLMKSYEFSILNSIATAEGAIAHAVNNSIINIHKSSGLVLGYGRVGKVLANKLKALEMKVAVCARSRKDLTDIYVNGMESLEYSQLEDEIHKFDFVFNTVPSVVLDRNILGRLSANTIIIDVASPPGGLDLEAAKELNLKVHICQGIPGKIAPLSSAKIIADEIYPILKERSD